VDAIVGREAELEAVERFLDALPEGPSALVVEGEAGIGKTTLWEEAVRSARARTYRVLVARPAESEAKLSYAALADLLADVFDEVRDALPAPQERALAVALLRTDADEAADARTTATALVGVLSALAATVPVLVAVDDVQWLDPASERALAFAVRRAPERLGFLLARRGDRGVEPPLGLDRAVPTTRLRRIVPGPLSLGALHHLVRAQIGTSPSRPMLARLAAASGGNPFFALEIARELATDGGERAPGDPLPVPRSLQEFAATRVRALSEPAQRAALAAAALSRPTVGTVSAALASELDPEAALADAESAGIIVSERGRIRFTHPLLASAVYGSASHEQHRQLHRRLAEVVAEPEERARHLAQSTNDADEATAGEVERAARTAAQRGAQAAAAELFAAASRLTPPDRSEDEVRRTLGEAGALLALGDVAGAHVLAERAASAASASSLQAQALALLANVALAEGTMRHAVDLLEQASAAAAGDRDLEGELAARLARFTALLDPRRAREHADAAARLLDEARHPRLLGHALIDRFWAEALLGRGARRELLERGIVLESQAPGSQPHGIPLIWFHCVDELDAARARHAMEDAWCRDHGEDEWREDRLAHLALIELRAGCWDLAEQHVETICGSIERADVRGARAMRFAFRSFIDAHRGRTGRARETLLQVIDENEQTEQNYWTALALSFLGFAEFADGDDAAAHRALTLMRERLDAIGIEDSLMDRSEPFHVESLLALGELDRAGDVLARLEERGRTLPRPWIAATLPRTRALMLAAEGDLAAALDQFDGEEGKLPFENGWTLLAKGRLLRRAKQKRAAAEALRRALEIFEQLGAPAWSARARAELARVGLRRRSPDELTPTERRVAELAAGGLTNREVAKAAFMSPKTVEANLARVYRKLGIRSRAELGARIADEQRAVETPPR
jgi:DNA-binding CsgD family transcriptional regulator